MSDNKKEYRIKLGNYEGDFIHSAYITCQKIEKISSSEILADGLRIDFMLLILKIDTDEEALKIND